ncbi:MAG: hypothetical protein HOK80_04310 [Candidatus Cloacimonetes bacterium]|nr:hypothetical protein [Candidatus Cloacimonadota bacterium]MBT4334027.1 hypothetical protein [Candidatus Cloacimonadota bacterium]MBT4574868.1 hypothetical protein [Candidatus Cloacimonadota bacterium]MBT5420091.1 hypothetical protein [Candidatus Cloacimonadota bacterium]
MKKIISIIGWVILLLAFASLGLSSDDPTFGFFFYLVFFIATFALVYLYIKNHQRKTEIDPKKIALAYKISGIVLLLVALFSPILALKKIGLPILPNILILLATVILIGLGGFAIKLINDVKQKKILGYVLLIFIAAIPAIFAITFLSAYFPNAYNALGTSYWAIVSVSVFAWWGFTLYSKKD